MEAFRDDLTALELVFLLSITSANTSTWQAVGRYSDGEVVALALGSIQRLLLLSGRLATTAHWLPIPVYTWQPWELYAGATTLSVLALLVYWKHFPASVWSVWVLLALLPFVLTNSPTIITQPWWCSRYLYLASAGTSALLACGMEVILRPKSWGPTLYGGVLAALCISSGFYLKQSEAISLYASGRNYVGRDGDFETGILQFKRAIERGRNAIDLEDTYERICYMGMGKDEEEAVLDEALAAFPNNVELNLYKLALDSMKADSLLSTRAREELELLRSPDPPVSIATRSGKRITLRDKKAIQGARRQVAAFYHNTGNNLGTGRVNRENLERAILAYRRSLEFDPDRTGTSEHLAIALASAGRQNEAVMVALEAVERNPDGPVGLQVTASFALLSSGRAEEAIALGTRALKDGSITDLQSETVFKIYGGLLDGKYGEFGSAAATRMGIDLWDGGRTGEAVRAFRLALEHDADDSRAHFGLGLALLAQGQVEEAERLYADGLARFGRAAAEEAGAAEGIRSLIARGLQVEGAREILSTHWPDG